MALYIRVSPSRRIDTAFGASSLYHTSSTYLLYCFGYIEMVLFRAVAHAMLSCMCILLYDTYSAGECIGTDRESVYR